MKSQSSSNDCILSSFDMVLIRLKIVTDNPEAQIFDLDEKIYYRIAKIIETLRRYR